MILIEAQETPPRPKAILIGVAAALLEGPNDFDRAFGTAAGADSER